VNAAPGSNTLGTLLSRLNLPPGSRVLDIGGAVQGGKDSTEFLLHLFDGPIDAIGHLSGNERAVDHPFGQRVRLLEAVPDAALPYDLVLLCPTAMNMVMELREFAIAHSPLVAPGGYLICHGILPEVVGKPDCPQPVPRLLADFLAAFAVSGSGELQLPFFLGEYECCGTYPRKNDVRSYLGWYVLRKRNAQELHTGEPALAELARLRQVDLTLRRARKYLDLGHDQEAAAAFEAALAVGADEADCRPNLGPIYERAGQWEQALEQWQWLHRRDPRQAAPAVRLARACMRLGRYDEAVAGFAAALAAGGDEANCRLNLARIHLRTEQWEKARKEWQWLHEHEPQQADHALQLARTYVHLGRDDEAAVGFEAALAAGADPAACHLNLARIYERGEQWEKALESWEGLHACDPTELLAWSRIAQLLFRLGREPEVNSRLGPADPASFGDGADPARAALLARRLAEAQTLLPERTLEIERLRQTVRTQQERLLSLDVLRPFAPTVDFAERILQAKDELRADAYVAHLERALPGLARLSQLVGGRLFCDVVEIPSLRDQTIPVDWPDPVVTLLDSAFERLLEQCHALLTIGPTLGDRLMQYGPPVHVIENYRPLQPLVASNVLRQMCAIGERETLILALSRQVSGFEDVVDCMSLLPLDVHLAVVGPFVPRDYDTAIRQLVADRRLDNRVHFFDVVPYEELTATASGADVGLIVRDPKILNNYVSLPNRVFDYVCSGLPICAPDIPDIKSYLQRYGLGEVVDEPNAAGWAAAISKALQQRDELRQNALRAAAELTWESREERLCRIFDGMERVVFADYGPLHLNNRTLRMCQSLRQRGHRVAICTVAPKDPPTLVPGIEYHFL
jgi:tetratricopeptide (TPR) repeat protein